MYLRSFYFFSPLSTLLQLCSRRRQLLLYIVGRCCILSERRAWPSAACSAPGYSEEMTRCSRERLGIGYFQLVTEGVVTSGMMRLVLHDAEVHDP